MVPPVSNNNAGVKQRQAVAPPPSRELVSIQVKDSVDQVTISLNAKEDGEGQVVTVEAVALDKAGRTKRAEVLTIRLEGRADIAPESMTEDAWNEFLIASESDLVEFSSIVTEATEEEKEEIATYQARIVRANGKLGFKFAATMGQNGRDIEKMARGMKSLASIIEIETETTKTLLDSPNVSEETKAELKETEEETAALKQALADKCAELGIANPFASEKSDISESDDPYNDSFFINWQLKLNSLLQDLRNEISRVMEDESIEDKALDEKRAHEKRMAKKRELRKLEEKAMALAVRLKSIEFEKDPEVAKRKLAAASAEITKLARQYLDIRGGLSKSERMPLDLAFKKLLSFTKIEKEKLAAA